MSLEKFYITKNDRIYSDNDPSMCFYIVVNGAVDIYDKQEFGLVINRTVYEDYFFGYKDYFNHRSRSEIAVASEKSLVFAVDKKSVNELIELIPSCKNKIRKILSSMLDEQLEEGDMYLHKRHENYLFIRDIKCPVCENQFKVNHPRYTKLIQQCFHEDFRRVYKNFDDLWYQIWHCPHCGYINFYDKFYDLTNKLQSLLYQSMPRTKKTIVKYIKSSYYEIIEEYEKLYKYADLYNMSLMTRARIWQSIAWLYEDLENEAKVDELYDTLKHSLEDTWKDSATLKSDVELKIAYKVSLLYEKDGNIEQAIQFLYKAVETTDANKLLKHKAADKLYTLVKEYRDEREAKKLKDI